jgi:hypothetical protein
MTTTTVTPAVGATYLTGKTPLIIVPGVTFGPTTNPASGFQVATRNLNGFTLSRSLNLAHLATNVKTGLGYIPAGVTVFAFTVKTDDLDSGTALVQSLFIDSTEVATGLTVGRTAGSTLAPITPTAITAPAVVYIKTTTKATTPTAGAVYVTPWYYPT